jgi:acetyltransferase-like isoleucine patch superfamily enzyme
MNVGEGTYFAAGDTIKILHPVAGHDLIIGKYCAISTGCSALLCGDHRTDWISMYPFPEFNASCKQEENHWKTKGNIVIGNGVWIGHGVCFLSGVTVGDGAVIGAWSVVSKNIPPYAVAVGNPIRVVRYRFTPEVIEKLKEIKWWDWPPEKIKQFLPLLLSKRIDDFLEAVK